MPTFAHLPDAPMRAAIALPAEAGFDAQIDEAKRIVRIEASGCWTLAETEDHIADLAAALDECRRRFGRARALVDRRGVSLQSPAIVQRLAEANTTLFGEHDRLAVVVESSLAKGEMRRRLTHAGSQAFLSYEAAELWLTAWP